MTKTSILVHIPHSSFEIPFEYQDLFKLTPIDLTVEQLKMVDSYTNDLFNLPTKKIVFPISRLICDVERFRNEKDEIMTKQGMWVCYKKTSNLIQLKQVSKKHKEQILTKYYDPHHLKFEKEVEKCLKNNGKCLIIDGHSFSSIPQKYEVFGDSARPDICIGTDDFHTPIEIKKEIVAYFLDKGYKVGINVPFKGSIVPLKYYQQNPNVHTVMIEINRKLYMNEQTGKKNIFYKQLKSDIKNVYQKLSQYY